MPGAILPSLSEKSNGSSAYAREASASTFTWVYSRRRANVHPLSGLNQMQTMVACHGNCLSWLPQRKFIARASIINHCNASTDQALLRLRLRLVITAVLKRLEAECVGIAGSERAFSSDSAGAHQSKRLLQA